MRYSIIVVIGVLFAGCTVPVQRYPAQGMAGFDHVVAEVDSELASYFLGHYRRSDGRDHDQDAFIDNLLESYDRHELTTDALVSLARETSNDFAAIYFARRMTREHSSLKTAFLAHSDGPRALSPAGQYTVVFVPGLFYESKPESKGDLRDAEDIVRSLGIATDRVATSEAASVEQNAETIAEFIRRYPTNGREIILVSASKGGPEVLHALGNLLTLEESVQVRAWLSIGGVLRGSQVADSYLSLPKSVIARLAAWWLDFDVDLVRSLATDRSRERLHSARLPKHVTVLHYVGVPLSGTVSAAVRGPYNEMSVYGPSDGLTLLTDQLLPGERVLTDLGLDHRFAHPQIAEKTAALTMTLLEILDATSS